MSNQQQQRVRRIGSPSTKSGPMKATLTFGLIQGSQNTASAKSSNGRKSSPSSSPTPQWGGTDPHRRTRRSPDNRLSPDRAASSSPGFKEKQKILRPSPIYHPSMKRTGSIDTITPYLKGEWPKGDLVPVLQTTDQETQTPEEWQLDEVKKKPYHKRSPSAGNTNNDKEKSKARLAKNSKDGSRTGTGVNVHSSPVQGKHLPSFAVATVISAASAQTKAVAMPVLKPTIRIRNSVEGPSQEIEKLVYSEASGNEELVFRTQESVQQVDGHRAPVRDLLAGHTRTIDTQTPSGSKAHHPEEDHSCSSTASDSPCSLPIIPGNMDSPPPSSTSDSSDSKEDKERDLLFIREPPDGCERARVVDEPSQGQAANVEALARFCPIKNTQEKCIIPSCGSAFLPLFKPYVTQPSEMASKTPGDRPLEN